MLSVLRVSMPLHISFSYFSMGCLKIVQKSDLDRKNLTRHVGAWKWTIHYASMCLLYSFWAKVFFFFFLLGLHGNETYDKMDKPTGKIKSICIFLGFI